MLPASKDSVEGIDSVSSLMQMSPSSCLYTYNLMPSEYGLRLRKGYREWATGCVENPQRAENVDAKTIIPFESNIQDPANDRLFAVTAEGIWDVTLFNTTAPVQEVVFTQTEDPAGYGVWTEFTGDAAGDGLRGHYMFYADGLNGIWQYEESTDTWAQPPSGVGPADWHYLDPTDNVTPIAFPVDNVAFVMVFKQRIWVILEDEDDAWYLPTASITGELKRFTFGSKMPSGGNLVGLWTWTVDGGDGIDDMLVAVSRGGDVIIYQGEDPEITPDGSSIGPWSTRGTWFVGEVPASRRLVVNYGPNMYLLSTFGLTSLNDLLRGSTPGQASYKVNRFLRTDVESGKASHAWQLVAHPADGFLQVITPKPAQTPYAQYNLNLQTGAWGIWEGVPSLGADSWSADFFMGGPNGIVYINDGTLDGTEIAKPNFFQDVGAVVGDGWTVPIPLEFQCDGSQVAETEYTTTTTGALVAGVNYIAFYRVKPNSAPTNFFQDVPTVPPGAEWTVPIAGEYECDGTQVAETEYRTDTTAPLKEGVRYEFFFTMAENSAGNFKVKVGSTDILTYNNGAGQYSATFTPSQEENEVALVGDADFVGKFTNVVVAYYDGAGQHKLQVGGVDVTPYKTGSGAFSGVFTATGPDTTISLVGDEDFTGTMLEVSVRVQSAVGEAVTFRTLTSFQAPAGHSNFNRVGLIRTIGVVAGTAAVNVRAIYDYSIEQEVKPPVLVGSPGQNVWDSAVWDRDLWDFSTEGQSFTYGSLGVGRTFAVAVNGNASTRITIVGWDVLFQTGGYL